MLDVVMGIITFVSIVLTWILLGVIILSHLKFLKIFREED